MGFWAYKKLAILYVLILIFSTTIAGNFQAYSEPKHKEPDNLLITLLTPNVSDFLANKADLFSGTDVTANAYYGYLGATWAPFSALDQPGWRLRIVGGTGRYRYDGELNVSGNNIPIDFVGDVSAFDMLIGYQHHYGAWVLKGFVGANYTEHLISPEDPDNDVQGTAFGVKGQLELWWSIDETHWISADASYATSFGDFWSQIRYGYEPIEWFALGPEVTALGHQDYATGRAGLFGRFQTDYGDLTLSGGVTGNFEEDPSPYGALGFYQKF